MQLGFCFCPPNPTLLDNAAENKGNIAAFPGSCCTENGMGLGTRLRESCNQDKVGKLPLDPYPEIIIMVHNLRPLILTHKSMNAEIT